MLITILFVAFSVQVSAQGKNSGGTSGNSGGNGSGAVDQDQTRDQDRIMDPSTHEGDEPDQDRLRLQDQDRIRIDDESLKTATSGSSLKLMIQQREREFEKEASTSDEKVRNMVQNENRVRVAVQALLLSRDFLGGIGPQVSQIARQIADSQASTTLAETDINNRGFLQRLFFGGDLSNATVIQRELERNQERVAELKQFLSAATSTPLEVRNMLEEQIRNIESEQERLGQLAEKESSRWGLFSWRF